MEPPKTYEQNIIYTTLYRSANSQFDVPVHLDIPIFDELIEFYKDVSPKRQYRNEIEFLAGSILKFRIMKYAFVLIEQEHQRAWAKLRNTELTSDAPTYWPSQLIIETYFYLFVSMCKASLDGIALWLNTILDINYVEQMVDFNDNYFQKKFKNLNHSVYKALKTRRPWIKELSEFRDAILHRKSIDFFAAAVTPKDAGFTYVSLVSEPGGHMLDSEWVKKIRQAEKEPSIGIDIFCKRYEKETREILTVVLKEGFDKVRLRKYEKLL